MEEPEDLELKKANDDEDVLEFSCRTRPDGQKVMIVELSGYDIWKSIEILPNQILLLSHWLDRAASWAQR